MGERRSEIKREGISANTPGRWNVDYISAEQNIESIGYFSATYSRRSITDSRVSKILTLSDNRTIEILPSKKYGLPNAEDLDFYRAFLKICHERVRLVRVEKDDRTAYHPELPVPIGFSSRELTAKANKKWSGRTNRAVREWIERLNSTAIHGAIFSAKDQRYDVRIGLEPLFRQYVHVGHLMADGQIAPQNYVWPAQWFLDNYYHLYTRPIDLKFHHSLTCSIAKALYPLLDTGWFASTGSPYTKRYTDLCALLDIQPYKQMSRVQQQLDPSHTELLQQKFLASYDYPVNDDGQWSGTVRWWPGPKWLFDQESRNRNKQGNDSRLASPVSFATEKHDRQQRSIQGELPLLSYHAAEIPEEYESRVKEFYSRVGQGRLSRMKIEAGAATIRRLAEDENFTLGDIDYALEWIVRNLDTRFDGSVKSLGLLSHVMGEALQERARKDRKKEQQRTRRAEEEQEQGNMKARQRTERELNGLPVEELQQIREQAIENLARQGVKLGFMLEGVIKSEMLRLVECKK